MNSRQRFLATLNGEPTDRPPVFPLLMFFAAGRVGLTYRQFASDGAALAEAQMAVFANYSVDAITACSDAFRLSADLGGEIDFPEETPPHLVRPLVATASDITRLGHPDPTAGRMGDRARAIEIMARGVGHEAAVLGWVDMPFAEACSCCGVSNFMLLLVDEPDTAHALLNHLTECVIAFALAQAEAGAVMIGAGDAAASLISAPMYEEFALPYERRVIATVHAAGNRVKLHICGDTRALLPLMATSGADLFNVDHLVPLADARDAYTAVGAAYKGNLNPVTDIMQATPDDCRQAAFRCLETARGTKYMLSAGCEIPAETPDDVFRAFCAAPGEWAAG